MADQTTEPAPLEPMLTKADIANHARVTTRTVEHWMTTGILPPAIRVGRERRWPRSEYLTWLETQREDATK